MTPYFAIFHSNKRGTKREIHIVNSFLGLYYKRFCFLRHDFSLLRQIHCIFFLNPLPYDCSNSLRPYRINASHHIRWSRRPVRNYLLIHGNLQILSIGQIIMNGHLLGTGHLASAFRGCRDINYYLERICYGLFY